MVLYLSLSNGAILVPLHTRNLCLVLLVGTRNLCLYAPTNNTHRKFHMAVRGKSRMSAKVIKDEGSKGFELVS